MIKNYKNYNDKKIVQNYTQNYISSYLPTPRRHLKHNFTLVLYLLRLSREN